ncbi:radical SAM family heme chaperone HemW [Proteiniclasticum sp. C24MP]|uniref:radical SAM family heme chaperone HemW n=1 Tax=Proteiniclasticum sp. C24MP TaxID=3374101 RepID=UPI003754ED37
MKTYGLYIHIPFCEQKCYYCDFASYSGKGEYVKQYLNALATEIASKTQGKTFDTVFIGGGTPSYLSAEELRILSESLRQIRLTEDHEFSMECNPGNLTKEKAYVIKEMGVNRLSIGLQSSDDHILLDIGRIHTFHEFKDNYLMLREMGFDNINVDIIYGLPNENKKILKKTLEDVLALKPDHISCYSLIIEEFTPFYFRHKNNELHLPDEETEREMNTLIISTLKDHGYERYEISNYALGGKECRHNIRYWEGRDYVGCGTSAHEYVHGERQENVRTIEGYIRMIEKEGTAAIREHQNTFSEDVEEYVFMGMRMMKGLSKRDFQERFHVTLESLYRESIDKHVRDGLLVDTAETLRFTDKGIEFSNHVLSDFLLSS